MSGAIERAAPQSAAVEVAASPPTEYAAALDGLRGVAIAAVLVYHGVSHGWQWGAGGFLGVDLFLVLSGYLITRLLLAQFDRRDGNLRSFWSRRVRRLLPAMLIAYALAAVVALTAPNARLHAMHSDAIFSALYIQNWHVIWTHGTTAGSGLSHTWSLSIEEQWYAVWPLALFAAIVVAKLQRRTVACVLIALAVASLVATVLLYDPADTTRAFFGTDTRGGGLLIGAIIALFSRETSTFTRPRVRYGVEIAAWCAALFIGFELVWTRYDDAFLYRGGFTLVWLATALVVLAALRSDSYMRRALSWRPLVALGLISYGLYLYHPLINHMVDPERTGMSPLALLPLRLLITFVVAYASYRFLERPIRDGRLMVPRPAFVVPSVAALVFLLVFLSTNDAPKPIPVAQAVGSGSWLDEQYATTPSGATRVLVAGETDALLLQQRFQNTFDGAGIRGVAYGLYGCSIAAGDIVLDSRVLPQSPGCDQWPRKFREVVNAYRPDVVVLMAGDQHVFDRRIDGQVQRVGSAAWRASMARQLDAARLALTADGARLVIATTPCRGGGQDGLGAMQADTRRVSHVNAAFRTYAAANALPVADFAALLCPKGQRLSERDGHVYSDGHGLTDDGARLVWGWVADEVRQADP